MLSPDFHAGLESYIASRGLTEKQAAEIRSALAAADPDQFVDGLFDFMQKLANPLHWMEDKALSGINAVDQYMGKHPQLANTVAGAIGRGLGRGLIGIPVGAGIGAFTGALSDTQPGESRLRRIMRHMGRGALAGGAINGLVGLVNGGAQGYQQGGRMADV